MPGQLGEHVVEEAEARIDIAPPASIEVDTDENVRLVCLSMNLARSYRKRFARLRDGGQPHGNGGAMTFERLTGCHDLDRRPELTEPFLRQMLKRDLLHKRIN